MSNLTDQQLFEQISEKYIRKDLAAPSRLARKLRLKQTLRAANLPSDGVILEVGCAAGFTVDYMDGQFSRYYGVDYARDLINYANNRGIQNVSFHACGIQDFNPPEPVDVVLMIGVIHHFDDMSAALGHIRKLLRPGGVIVANEPQPANPLISLARIIRKKVDKGYSSDQRELTAKELRNLYESAGFEEIEVVPQGILSTPFAEVILKPEFLSRALSRLACLIDVYIEKLPKSLVSPFAWNVIAVGRRPRDGKEA